MGKADLIKGLKKEFKVKGGSIVAKEPKGRTAAGGAVSRCWEGYEPVEGKKPFSKGSCKKVGGAVKAPLGSDPNTWTPKYLQGSGLQESRQRLRQALDDHKRILHAVQQVHQKHSQGGQLPCRVTDKMKGLEMKGSGFFKGKDAKVTDECKDRPECLHPEKCKKLASMTMGPNGMMYMGQYQKCLKDEKEKANCPEKCYEGGKRSGLERIGDKIADPLMKANKVALAATVVAGQPAFLASCGAAGTALGGPLGGMAGAAACKGLYDKMIKQPGYEDGLIDSAGMTDTQKKLLTKMGEKGTKAAGGAVKSEDPIDWEDIKWGSFKAQYDQYNATHKKKFKDLGSFADHILAAEKGKFQPKTLKRARFYKNVLARKKS